MYSFDLYSQAVLYQLHFGFFIARNMPKVSLFFFLVSLITVSFALCPTHISKICSCEDNGPGFVVSCHKPNSDLNTFLSTMEKLRIEQLTIVDASWPVSCCVFVYCFTVR